MTHRSRIAGIGAYVPPKVVTNHDLSQFMETSHEWILERSGIEERRWVEPGEGTAEMGAKAAAEALQDAGLDAKDVDMVIVATLSPDFCFPGSAVFVQRLMGLREIPCYDIRQQCSGFIYAVAMADAFIRMGQYKHILVIGSEVQSTGIDVSTAGRDVSVLFGDGAGAVVMTRASDETSMVLSTHMHADGREAEILWCEFPSSKAHPRIDEKALAERRQYPRMEGKKVFKHAVTKLPQVLMEGMVTNNLKLEQIDMLIPHQANLRINQMFAKMIGLPEAKMHNNIHKYGNTTAASIPICMHEAIKLGKIKRGDMVCLIAFGAGLTWGSAFLRY